MKCNYSMIEKLCLVLYFSSVKLRHYLVSHIVYVIAQTNVVKYMLLQPIVKRMNKEMEL